MEKLDTSIKKDQGRIEKWVLRRAFDDEERPYLPKVTNKMMQYAPHIFPHNTPTTKEGYYYKMIFERFIPQNSATLTVPGGPTVACSTAKAVEWDAAWANNLDPSGRAALGVHNVAYDKQAPVKHIPAKVMNGVARMMEAASAREVSFEAEIYLFG
ncbi:Asparagine synthetase [glutamine-hydrolyzing]-like protein [Drosera capensis]